MGQVWRVDAFSYVIEPLLFSRVYCLRHFRALLSSTLLHSEITDAGNFRQLSNFLYIDVLIARSRPQCSEGCLGHTATQRGDFGSSISHQQGCTSHFWRQQNWGILRICTVCPCICLTFPLV